MYHNLIKQYVDKLSINDVNNFLVKNSINLDQKELFFIFNLLKTDFNMVLNGNEDKVIYKIKNNVSSINYNKLYNLYLDYKQKFQGYL